jgi:hypothetical protein
MQFRLRTLLAAVTIACLALGIKSDQAYRQHQAAAAVVAAGGRVGYVQDGQSHGDLSTPVARRMGLGRDFLDHVSSVYWAGAPIKDADLDILRNFPRLSTLSLVSSPITDDGLKRLAACPRLELVDVRFTRVTEEGVGDLRRALPRAKILWLSDVE